MRCNSSSATCYHRYRNVVLPRSETCRFRPSRTFLILFFLCFVSLPRAFPADSNSLDDAVRQLADRIAAIPNLHGPLRLEFHADANLAADSTWQDTLRQELEKRRLPITDEPSALLLKIGAAETPTQVVLTASARIADRDDVRIVAFARAALSAPALAVAPIRIARQLVYESSDRILDASALGNAAEGGLAVLLDRNEELFAIRLDSSGAIKQTVSLAAANLRATRDPRGELTDKGATAEVLLPGKICEFTWAAGKELNCHAKKTEGRTATVLTSPCDASNGSSKPRATIGPPPTSSRSPPMPPPVPAAPRSSTHFPGPFSASMANSIPAARSSSRAIYAQEIMKFTKSLCFAAISAVLLFLLAAFPADAAKRPRYGGTLRVELLAPNFSLDPREWKSGSFSARQNEKLAALVYERLVTLDDYGRFQPALAIEWSHDAAAKNWQFKLRPNVKFSDGTPLAPG